MVEQSQVVVRLLLQVHAGACLAEHFRALQGVDAVAQAGLGTGGHVALPVGVVDVVSLNREGRVDGRLHRGEHLGVGTGGGEPELGAVLRHGGGAAAGGQQRRTCQECQEE